MQELRKKAAKAALEFIDDNIIVGVGTGNTVNYFIEELASIKNRIEACVASSRQTEALLKEKNIPVINLNSTNEIAIYIDSADEINVRGEMIKGGGGALTGEKIVASVAKKFICIVDEQKLVQNLGNFPIAIEVIPMARSFVARELVKLGANPEYRDGFVTDNGNIILDIFNLDMTVPVELEKIINLIPGVVENGIFARICADIIVVGKSQEVVQMRP